jgi:signal transduction histidine kinase
MKGSAGTPKNVPAALPPVNLSTLRSVPSWLYGMIISVPVRIKIAGIILLTVVTVGLTLNYWVTTSLADWLSYLLTDVRVEAAMRAGNRSILLITILAAAGSLIIASFLTFLLTRPLVDLRDMALEVANGNLEARAPVWAQDEIGEVALAINSMTDHLVDVQGNLARTNRRLAATNRVMVAAEQKQEIHDVLYAILESLTGIMGLETGWVYLHDPARNLFHLASWYGVPPEQEAALLQEQSAACCNCQRDLLTGRLSTHAMPHACDRLCLADDGTRPHHLTLPIVARGQQYGLLNLLFSPAAAVDDADMEMLSTLGAHISEVVANAWLRLKLAEKEQARQLLLESLVEAQEEERSHLARELHDGAGQMLTTLLVRIKTLEKECPTPALQSGLHALLAIVSETIDQVRDLSYQLRPAALEEFGLPVALGILVDEMTADLTITGHYRCDLADESLALGSEVILYRIAQEALTNVVRHAAAENVRLTLTAENNVLLLAIQDDGRGFDPYRPTTAAGQRNLGLISMRERAAMAGGALTVNSAPNAGTTLLVRVPLLEGITP